MKNRVELHCHTKMTEMEGLVDVRELIKKAKKMGMPAIAITDKGNVQAFPRAYDEWIRISAEYDGDDRYSAKVLFGLEAFVVNDQNIIVMNEKGQFFDTDYVVVDLETTGFSPVSDRIIEFGAIRISEGMIKDTFSCFVNPGMHIPDKIVELTGITNEMVSEADSIEAVLPRFLEFSKNAVLVAHNAPFDLSFIRENMIRTGINEDFTVIDTLKLSRMLLKDLNRHTLSKVASSLNIPIGNLHRASDDAELTAKVFLRFLGMIREMNITSLQELSRYSEKNYFMTRRMPGYKIIIIATNTEGIKNLYDLISEVSLESFDSFLKIPRSLLEEKREGLIIGSCAQGGDVGRAVFGDSSDDSDDNVRKLINFYDFVEVEPVDNYIYVLGQSPKRDDRINEEIKGNIKRIVEICQEESVPVVASSNVYYLEKSDVDAFKVLRHAVGFRDSMGWKAKHHLMSTEEMLAEFDFLGKETAETIVTDNPNRIVEGIDVLHPISPAKCYPGYPKASQVLETKCYEKACELYGEKLPEEVKGRIEYEMEGIKRDTNRYFSSLYMITHELVKKSHEAGYTVGARGCSGASLVAFLMGITETNPLPPHYICKKCRHTDFIVSDIKGFKTEDIGFDLPDSKCPVCGEYMDKDGYDIPVETFLGLNLDKEPDFDLNFSADYQKEAQKSVVSIDGVGTICRAGTIVTVPDHLALKYASKYFKENKSKRKPESIKRVAEKLVGVKRAEGVHPGGIVVVPKGIDITQYTPVLPSLFDPIADPIPRTQIEYHDFDGKLLKLDILGHDAPTFLRKLRDQTGVDPLKIPVIDKGVMSLFSNTKSLGIDPDQIGGVRIGTLGGGEFGSEFARKVIEDVKPRNFSDLIRITGLCHGMNTWFNNAEQLLTDGIPVHEWIAHRDDIMLFLQSKGVDRDQAFKIMEWIRMGRGSRKGLPAEYIDVMKNHDVPDWYIRSCEKIQYLFPKAHSAAYTLTSLRLLYYKLYYPEAFYRIWMEFASEIDRDFVHNGPDYARYVFEELKKKNPNKLGYRQQRKLYEILVVLEMHARGVTI